MDPNSILVVTNSLIMVLCSSTAMLSVKMAVNTSPTHLAICRCIISFIVSTESMRRNKVSPWPDSPKEKNTLLMRGLLSIVFIVTLYTSVKMLDFQIQTILFMLNVPFTILFSAILGKPSHHVVYLASLVSFLGCIFVVAPDILIDGISETSKSKKIKIYSIELNLFWVAMGTIAGITCALVRVLLGFRGKIIFFYF